MVAAIVLVVAAGVAGVVWVVSDRSDSDTTESAGSVSATTAVEPATTPARPIVAADTPPDVRLDEVWLLDRQDGTYDWGLIVESTDEVDRVGVSVEATLLDEDGEEVAVLSDAITVLPAGGRSVFGGELESPSSAPIRLETDVTTGTPTEAAATDTVRVRAIERREDVRNGDGEVLTGRLSSPEEAESIRIGALWRDGGVVVAAVFHDVERVRANVDARFEIPLDQLVLPDGEPDEVLVVR